MSVNSTDSAGYADGCTSTGVILCFSKNGSFRALWTTAAVRFEPAEDPPTMNPFAKDARIFAALLTVSSYNQLRGVQLHVLSYPFERSIAILKPSRELMFGRESAE